MSCNFPQTAIPSPAFTPNKVVPIATEICDDAETRPVVIGSVLHEEIIACDTESQADSSVVEVVVLFQPSVNCTRCFYFTIAVCIFVFLLLMAFGIAQKK